MKKALCLAIAAVVAIISIGCGPQATNNSAKPSANSSPGLVPSPQSCTAQQNRAIIAYIGNGVDSELASIKTKINWDAVNCTVYLTGWTGTIQNFKILEKYSLGAPAVVTMNNEKLWLLQSETQYPDPQACADGWTQCGDICIPPGQTCNNGGATKGASASPSPAGTSKP
jgi:hypothetical protein